MMKRLIPSRLAMRRLRTYPSSAPVMLSPIMTSRGATMPLTVAWVVVVRALYSVLSKPMKAEFVVVQIAWKIIIADASWMYHVASGLFRI